MSTTNTKMEKLLIGLDLAGVAKRGRNRVVAEKTEYSQSMVARILTGNVPLTTRFISAVCSAFNISKSFVETGSGTWYSEGYMKESVTNGDVLMIDQINESVVLREALKELQQMTEPRRWEAVGMLKRMNAGEL